MVRSFVPADPAAQLSRDCDEILGESENLRRLRQIAQWQNQSCSFSFFPNGCNIAELTAVAGNLQVEAILRAELDRAQMRDDAAHYEYRKILAELCHPGLSPNEIDRLDQASRAEMAARQELWSATARLDAFIQNGMVPEDLRALSERQQGQPDCAGAPQTIDTPIRLFSAEAQLKQ
jgi:uncharacterized protein YerC